MQIHQFVHTLNYGDAISGEALLIQRLLREQGISSEIYSVHAHHYLKSVPKKHTEFVRDLDSAKAAGEQVAVVLHYSIASPLNDMFREQQGFMRAMIYHNLTPVHWYTNYNPRVTKDLRVGRDELPKLLSIVDVALADSSYNLGELHEMGLSGGDVLPLALDKEKWRVSANNGISRILRSHSGVNLLHVGRFAPNKCIQDILKTFYFYHHKINRKSKLWLVGSSIDNELYNFELRRIATELRIDKAVEFVGSVSDTELRAFYENSDVYLCMSEHEGFCVPLIEAMQFDLPVISYGAGAVKETVGDAAVVIADKQPAKLAELIDLLITDRGMRDTLIERGRARASHFCEENFSTWLEDKLTSKLRSLVDGSQTSRQAQA